MPAERSSSSAARRTKGFRHDRAVARGGRIVPFLLGALLTAAPAAAGGPGVDAAARDKKAGAQQTFDAGSHLYDSKRYQEALTAFRASHDISASPNSRLMAARCLRAMDHNAEAYREFDAVALEAREKGETYEQTAKAAETERDDLKQKVALVTLRLVDSKEGVQVKQGEQVLPSEAVGTVLVLDPSEEVFSASAPDGSTAKVSVSLAAGSSQEVELRLETPASRPEAAPPPPPPPREPVAPPPTGNPSLRTWALVAGGVGVVGLGAFAAFGAMSQSKLHALESSCPGHQCPPDRQGDIDSGKQFRLLANVGLALGVVGLGAGVTLFVIGSSSSSSTESKDVSLVIGPTSVNVVGRM